MSLNIYTHDGPFVPSQPDADSEMAKDRETRTGFKEGIALILSGRNVLRHLDAVPDAFAKRIKDGVIRLTAAQMAEAVTGPVVEYALANPDATPGDALAFVLNGPISVTRNRTTAAGTKATFNLAEQLGAAIAAAKANAASVAENAPENAPDAAPAAEVAENAPRRNR